MRNSVSASMLQRGGAPGGGGGATPGPCAWTWKQLPAKAMPSTQACQLCIRALLEPQFREGSSHPNLLRVQTPSHQSAGLALPGRSAGRPGGMRREQAVNKTDLECYEHAEGDADDAGSKAQPAVEVGEAL